MSKKICFIGAGSIGFTRELLTDLMSVPELRSWDISFTDINQKNLDMVHQLCQRDFNANGIDIKIHAAANRREALTGAKYVGQLISVQALFLCIQLFPAIL